MRIGLFGGSFDPPHTAHLIVAERMAEAFGLQEVIWMPAARSPHKQNHDLTPVEVRMRMVHAATQDNQRFSVSDIEVRRGGISYTIDTLRELAASRATDRFSLIIGSDSLESFGRWHEPRGILEIADLLVYNRPGALPVDVPDWIEARTSYADAPRTDISATDIRSRRALGQSIRYLVPAAVEAIIENEGLYR